MPHPSSPGTGLQRLYQHGMARFTRCCGWYSWWPSSSPSRARFRPLIVTMHFVRSATNSDLGAYIAGGATLVLPGCSPDVSGAPRGRGSNFSRTRAPQSRDFATERMRDAHRAWHRHCLPTLQALISRATACVVIAAVLTASIREGPQPDEASLNSAFASDTHSFAPPAHAVDTGVNTAPLRNISAFSDVRVTHVEHAHLATLVALLCAFIWGGNHVQRFQRRQSRTLRCCVRFTMSYARR